MGWSGCYENILPYVFSVSTPQGSGTGVFFMYNDRKTYAAIATAAHVVEHADEWKLPIKLRHHSTGVELFLTADERVVFLDKQRDSASILFRATAFKLPDQLLPMMAADHYQPIGSEVAWVGYPSIAYPNLCFFSGRISSFEADGDSYLVDGVAINGVSGGPVFAAMKADQPQLLWTVSAYISNRLRGDTLPGLLRVQDVTPFHDAISTVKSIDDARRIQQEEEARRLAEQQAAPAGEPQPALAATTAPNDGGQA